MIGLRFLTLLIAKDCNNKNDRDGLPHVDRDLDESVQAFHNFLCFIQALSRTVAFPSQIAYQVVWAGLAYFLVHICGLSAWLSYSSYLNGDRRSMVKKAGFYGYLGICVNHDLFHIPVKIVSTTFKMFSMCRE